MFKWLIIPIVVALLAVSPSRVSAQTQLRREFDDSHAPYSESKRLYKEGVKYALAGLFPQAVAIFQQAVKLDPGFADAHFALGHAYADMGRWENAIASFERAVELNPKDLEAQDRLDHARDMLARQTGKPAKRESARPKTSEPTPRPLGEPVSMTSKPSTPPAATVVTPAAKSAKENSPTTRETPTTTTENSTAETKNAAATELALTRLYRVGPGDVLDIRVNDSTSPQSTLFTITPAGLLEHPMLAEPLHVGGMSVEEISTTLEADFKRRALMESPKVSVAVRDYASHTILVSGLVKDSGTKILRREAIPLYVVVADAQPLPEAARVTLVRSEANQTFEADLAQPTEMNILVRPGDVINLTANVTQFLYIGGEVKAPGEKTYRRGLTLTQAILSAGGMTNKAKEARLGRDDGHGFLNVTQIKLKDIESGKVADPQVRPGDRIMIVH